MISIIAAVDEGGVIGHGGSMPWCVPEDLRRFRELTMGATVIMGRRTFESLPQLLDGRRIIALTHVFRDETVASVGTSGGTVTKSSSGKLSLEGVETAGSLEEALSLAGVFKDETAACVGVPSVTATTPVSGEVFKDETATSVGTPSGATAKLPPSDVFIAGGETVYKEALPLADRLYITRVEGVHEGDTFFPPIDPQKWRIISRESHKGFEFLEYRRV